MKSDGLILLYLRVGDLCIHVWFGTAPHLDVKTIFGSASHRSLYAQNILDKTQGRTVAFATNQTFNMQLTKEEIKNTRRLLQLFQLMDTILAQRMHLVFVS